MDIKDKQEIVFTPIPMIVGFISAIVFGFISLRVSLKCVKKLKLGYFSLYLLMISVLTFIFIK